MRTLVCTLRAAVIVIKITDGQTTDWTTASGLLKKVTQARLLLACSATRRLEASRCSLNVAVRFNVMLIAKPREAVVSGLVPYALKNNETAKLLLDLVQPKLPEFLDAFNKRFPKGQDLHGGNIMFRKDGSMCYTDPVCGDSNITSRRLKARDFYSLVTLLEI